MENLTIKLEMVWRNCETKQIATIFKTYMKSIQAKRHIYDSCDIENTYTIDGDSTNWNRVQCHYYKDSANYCEENLLLVLRKRAGNYLIIQRKDERAFEIDYSGTKHLDETLLNQIFEEHKPLFEALFKVACSPVLENDNEIYHKTDFLHFEDDDLTGCYFKGHIDIDQWKRVASDFMKTECDIEVSDKYTTFKIGWYKVLPNGTMRLLNYQARGSFPVMECVNQ